MPRVDTTKTAPPLARSSQLTPQPQNTGTAAASARNGTSRNVRMVSSSATVWRPESTGLATGRGAFREAVMQYSIRSRSQRARSGSPGSRAAAGEREHPEPAVLRCAGRFATPAGERLDGPPVGSGTGGTPASEGLSTPPTLQECREPAVWWRSVAPTRKAPAPVRGEGLRCLVAQMTLTRWAWGPF